MTVIMAMWPLARRRVLLGKLYRGPQAAYSWLFIRIPSLSEPLDCFPPAHTMYIVIYHSRSCRSDMGVSWHWGRKVGICPLMVVCCPGAEIGQSHWRITSCFEDVFVCVRITNLRAQIHEVHGPSSHYAHSISPFPSLCPRLHMKFLLVETARIFIRSSVCVFFSFIILSSSSSSIPLLSTHCPVRGIILLVNYA